MRSVYPATHRDQWTLAGLRRPHVVVAPPTGRDEFPALAVRRGHGHQMSTTPRAMATTVNSPAIPPGHQRIMNGALIFHGTNDCVRQSAGSNVLNGLTAFSVTLWVKPALTNSNSGFVTADNANVNPRSVFHQNRRQLRRLHQCGRGRHSHQQGRGLSRQRQHVLQPGRWQNVAVTWTNGRPPKS